MSIQHDHTLNPVTALEFYANDAGQLILAGEGCHLKAFELETSRLLFQYRVFEDQAIHGVVARNHDDVSDDLEQNGLDIVVWGGSSLRVFSRHEIEALLQEPFHSAKLESFSESAVCTVSDWIVHVAISPHDTDEFAFVSAHNTVSRVTYGKNNTELSIVTLVSPARSILYSAHILWESEVVLVAAGTVFGEIIVWQCSVSKSECQILHKFTGHEGSIFGVKISTEVPDQNGKPRRLLASCSDDRTIRIWELNSKASFNQPDQESPAAAGYALESDGHPQITSTSCLAMTMGHVSRIWGVEFLIRKGNTSLMSFGEDATTQLWQLEGTNLIHCKTFAYHNGKNIWSRAIRFGVSAVVVTGGADGKISLFKISTAAPTEIPLSAHKPPTDHEQGLVQTRCWELDGNSASLPNFQNSDDPASISNTKHRDRGVVLPNLEHSPNSSLMGSKTPKKPKAKKIPKDLVNQYAFISEYQVLVTTTFGRVLVGELATCPTWREVNVPDSAKTDLKSYSVAKSILSIGAAFLGCANGNIYMYQNGRERAQHFGNVSNKVADMFTLCREAKVELLVTTLGGQAATLFECGNVTSFVLGTLHARQISVNLPERFVVTSAGICNSNLLVLGSRRGGLAVYDLQKSDKPNCVRAADDAVPGDSITSIVRFPESTVEEKHCYLLTTCRDGTYSVFRLAVAGSEITLIHQGTPPFGPLIEAAWFSGSDLMLYGFKSKSFIVWNETKQYEVSSIECGGAHRSFAYSARVGGDGAGHFMYTKASKLCLHSQSKPSQRVVKTGGHGREIKACAISEDGLIATGAEDTTIRIWRYGAHFDCLAVVQRHTTGIQHLQWHGSRYLFSSGGNEEFFVWAVESIPGFGIGLVCEASCPDQSPEKDLRIIGFDVSEIESSGEIAEGFLISLAYSDSTIRVYTYSKAEKFQLIAKSRYTSSCLMQLRHLKVCVNEMFFLTAATDGNLVVWKCSTQTNHSSSNASSFTQVSTHLVHQSSIKSLAITKLHNQTVVATGGDDNALAITIYQSLDSAPMIAILRSAHVAAITALSIVSSVEEKVKIVTSGNDQRVKEWEVSLNTELSSMPSFKKMGDVFTSIADVGDLTSLGKGDGDGRRVLVVGNGMEVYDVSKIS